MGFSPGDFFTIEGEELHREQKDTSIVLWNKDESKAILRLDFAHARKCYDDLYTCLYTAGYDPWS